MMKYLPNFLHYCRKLSIFALEHWRYGLSERLRVGELCSGMVPVRLLWVNNNSIS